MTLLDISIYSLTLLDDAPDQSDLDSFFTGKLYAEYDFAQSLAGI